MNKNKFSLVMVLAVTLLFTASLNFSVLAVNWDNYDWKTVAVDGTYYDGQAKLYAAEVNGHRVHGSTIRIGDPKGYLPLKVKFRHHSLGERSVVSYKLQRYASRWVYVEDTLKRDTKVLDWGGNSTYFRFLIYPEDLRTSLLFYEFPVIRLGLKLYEDNVGHAEARFKLEF